MNTSDVSVPVIGLLGGVGSGKSSIARMAANLRPGVVIDADAIGHELLDDPVVRGEIVERFGNAILGDDGCIVRSRLAAVVFGADTTNTRAQLESILHPRIGEEVERRLREARATPGIEWVFVDAALMLEAGWAERCDLLVFVDTSFGQRLDRVTKGRGWTAQELRRREAAQMPLDEKRLRADAVLDNDSTLEVAAQRLVELADGRLSLTCTSSVT